MEQSFKRCCSINALGCTEVDMLWHCSDGCPDLQSDFEESVEWDCEIGWTGEEDGVKSDLFHLIFYFSFMLICVC
jgi:hypothetical protein